MKTRMIAASLGALLSLAACAHTTHESKTTTSSTSTFTTNAPATVQITNNNMQDVDVFLDRGDEHTRLGMVTTGQTQTFNIPSNMLHAGNDLRVTVHPIGGGGDYVTDALLVHGGEKVDVVIAPIINQSRMSLQEPS
jgi:hypothetical protein